jgi:hypothetical protein
VFQLELDALVARRPYPAEGPPLTEIRPRADRVARALEKDFLWDREASAIDLIGGLRKDKLTPTRRLPSDPLERALTYRGKGKGAFAIEWARNDFPSNGGPHVWASTTLNSDLGKLRPERRANTGRNALCDATRYAQIAPDIEDNCRLLPQSLRPAKTTPATSTTHPSAHVINNATAKWFLLENAISSLEVMAAAAKREYGVTLLVGSAYRTAATARRNAERRGSRVAVAGFSVHMLGVGMDLFLSYKDLEGHERTFTEIDTHNFPNVLAMRTSPAHKFMFLFGVNYGWYPYTVEPWHWEYNPPNFSSAFPSGTWTVSDPFAPIALQR